MEPIGSRDHHAEAGGCTLGTSPEECRHAGFSDHHSWKRNDSDPIGRAAGWKRSFGTGSKRGCRGSRPGACRRRRQRSFQHAVADGCDSRAEGHGKEEERRAQEEEEAEQKEKEVRQEEEEEKGVVDIDLSKQPLQVQPVQQFSKLQRFFRSSSVEEQGEGSAGEVRGGARCGQGKVQTQGRTHRLRNQAPRCPDGTFLSINLCSTLKRKGREKCPVERGERGGLGSSAFRAIGSEGRQRGSHTCRGHGQYQQEGDRACHGHPVTAHIGHSASQEEGGQLGQSRSYRADPRGHLAGVEFDAGSHKLARRFRRAQAGWVQRNGAVSSGLGYFCMIFSSLEKVFGHSRSALSYGSWLWDCARGQKRLRRRAEFTRSFLKSSEHGCSMPHVFPLPPFCKAGRVVEYSMGFVEHNIQSCTAHGVNLVQSVLNMLHGGQKMKFDCISAAHQRIQTRLESGLKDMMMDFSPMGTEEVHEFLRHQEHYAGGGPAIPLGSRGGVPSSAATVDLHSHLLENHPDLAAQVVEPKLLLLPSRKRPIKIKRGHSWLHSSYPALVERNVKAGLHILKKGKEVAKHRGRLCLTGAFAVKKDQTEDRVITDPSVNQLIDPQKLPRPRFAYIPKLRVSWVPRTGKLLVTKRDARHYFHSLRIGRKWHKWLCGPPIFGLGGGLRYPACCSAPMGFGPSAGWAQALTDETTIAAALPEESRVHPDTMAPDSMPMWGSICDDIWAIDHAQDEDDPSMKGPGWLARAEEAWVDRGVFPNHKKSVNGKGGEEVQGYFIHADEHWVGVSFPKRHRLFQATWHLLSQHAVLVADVDRLVGKFGFIHSCRPMMRSVFVEVYGWLDWHRSRKVRMAVLPDDIWTEIMVASLLLPYAHFNLSSEFSTRVECTDASMTGIGRAWATMPADLVQKMAQLSDHPGLYTNLALPHGIGLTEAHVCPLRKLKFPTHRFHWYKIGAPAAPVSIFLGEADAAVWASEDRLRRVSDDNKRFVHPMDSASCVGAFMKGRSASKLLNCRCQRLCSIGIAGGHEVFYPWVPSGDNPADEPSRRFEPEARQGKEDHIVPDIQATEIVYVDPFNRLNMTYHGDFFVHLCSGPDRECDLADWVERLAHEHGLDILGIRVDPLATPSPITSELSGVSCNDMLNSTHMHFILSLIHTGRVKGLFVSPPRSTFSAARHKALTAKGGGPRPLRSREHPWVALAGRSTRERHAVDIGTALGLISIGMLGEARAYGAWVGGEHPADRQKPPFPSLFCNSEVSELKSRFKLSYYQTDQCMFGAPSRKPTGLILPADHSSISRECNHRFKHALLLGWDSQLQVFRTTAAAKYPSGFSQQLALMFVKRLLHARAHGYQQPYCPRFRDTDPGVDPWTGTVNTAWQWPSPGRDFLAQCIERCNQDKVRASHATPQS